MMPVFWNIPLVALSVLVAMIGSFTALTHAERMRLSTGCAVRWWMLAGGVTLGMAIWSMHFIGMLAWQLSIPVSYDEQLTLLSVVPAIGTALLGFYVLRAPKISAARIAGASLLMGIGISMMHYTGMAALAMYPAIKYQPSVVILSVVIAIVAAAGALLMMYRGERIGLRPLPRFCLGSVVMGLAISGMHYSAMHAVAIHPDSIGSMGTARIEPTVLATMVSLISLLWFVIGILATLFDQRMAQQNARALEELRVVHAELHARARQMAEEMTQELREKEERVQLLLESVAEAIYGVDREGCCIFVNTPCLNLLGYQKDELIGRSIHDLIHHTRDDGSPNPVEDSHLYRACWHNECSHADEEIFWRKDGSFFSVECWSHPICHDGQIVGAVVSFFDITKRKAAEAARQEALDRLQKIASQLPGAVYQLRRNPDGSFCVPYVSDGIRDIYRINLEDIRDDVTQALVNAIHPDDRDDCWESAVVSARDLTPWHHEYRLKFDDGSERWVLGNALPQREADGSVLWHGFITDITERKQMEETLLKAKLIAEEAAHAKSTFLANMSHEIRTPMNAIIGLSYLALKTGLTPRQLDYISKIHKAGNSLLGIINDILDFSKIDTGKLELDSSAFSFQGMLDNVSNLIAQEAKDKGLQLIYKIPEDMPRYFVGDSLRFGHILINLLNNAIKFTERGEVQLSAESLEQTGGQIKLRFTVHDSGIGMTTEQMNRLFQPFSQADGTTSRKYGGTGLGLSITKRLIEMMHGQIWVESEANKGSCFTFTVWLGLLAEQAINPHDLTGKPLRSRTTKASGKANELTIPRYCGLNGVRILLAEDNKINQQITAELLGGVGATVDIVNNGREAVEKMIALPHCYDVVLMNIQMPDMDGYEATKMIRADARFGNIPILAMTAHALDDERELSLAAGMDDHISKPIEPDRLFQTLEYWIKTKPQHMEQNDVITSPTQLRGAGKISIPGIDVDSALRRVTGNQKLFDHLLQQFCEEQADVADRINAALVANDYFAAGRIAHAVKGVAGNIGAITMQDAASQLEKAIKENAELTKIRTCLQRFANTMKALIDNITSASAERETAASCSSTAAFDKERLKSVIAMLSVYLVENNSKAIACFDAAHDQFKAACNGSDFAKLEKAIYAFEFDVALLLLNAINASL